jgi:UDP-N-acetylmuramate-alanine ligase
VLPGRHNLSNAVVAIAMALTYGCNTADVIAALKTYSGVKRRFSYKILTKNFVFIDDYAHHPTEIDAVYQAVTELYPNTKTMVIFQPHLYSRTSDFLEQFANSLSQFNCVRLLPIYPARELPIEGVNSQVLLNKMTISNKNTFKNRTYFLKLFQSNHNYLSL